LGDESSDTQTLWGRVAIPTGPVSVTGSVIATNFTGSLQGTASYATQALSASQAQNANTASFALNGGVTQILAGPNIIVSPLSGKGQVTISSTGTGTGSFNTATGSYGSFYDTTIQPNPVANTPNSMSFNETAITNGVLISGSISPFNTYIKTIDAGTYNIQFSAQVEKTDSGTDEIDIWIRKNGNDLLDTATKLTLQNNNTKVVAAWNWFVQSATNDYYQLIWSSADTGMRLFAEPSSSLHPGIPSVIATANRVDQFLSNTGSFNGDFNGSFTGSLQGTASFATNALSASYAPSNPLPSGIVSGSQQIVDLGFATTSSVNQKLDTGSFNTYTASMDARTGSYATTGSNIFRGNQVISGSLIGNSLNNGMIFIGSEAYESGSVKANITASAAISQSNIFFGATTGPAASNLTGSIVISGSNNIFMAGPRPSTIGTANTYGYIGGNTNIMMGPSTLNTGSILRPSMNGNIIAGGGNIGMTFTSSSVAGGQPTLTTNIVNSTMTVNMGASGSISAGGNIINGATSLLQTGSAIANLRSTFNNNNINSSFFVQNYQSSSFTANNNNTIGASHYIDNNFVNGFGTAGITVSRNLFQGQLNYLNISGSPATNLTRTAGDSFFGGFNVTGSLLASGSNNGNLSATIIYGNHLNINGTSAANYGGNAFFGRYNDTGSLSNSGEIVFAVGTGTAPTTRRTGLYITTGSLVGVSGSLDVKGNTTITGSVTLSGSAGPELIVIGDSEVTGTLKVTVGITGSLQGTASYATNALTASFALNGGGGGSTFPFTGSAVITGSLAITGSASGNVNALSISSNTASLNLNDGNFFTLQLVSGSNTFIDPSNIKAGQTVNILISTTGSATVSFPTIVDQVSGSSYIPTTTTGKDIITLVSFDSTNLYLANVKNLV
jgi:hypothetical protein